MAYGKLINGRLVEAPNVLNKDGKQYINPPHALYLENGYLPMEYTIIPVVERGYHLVQSWIDAGDRLVQRWNYEADGVEDTSTLQDKINQLENIIRSIQNPYNIENSNEFPEGDYMNPIHLVEGGIITKKNRWYYTNDIKRPHMAIIEGFATISRFNDRMWFDFVE